MNSNKLLFCFTFAGGTIEFYNKLESVLPSNISMIKLEYAGHGSRSRQKLCENFYEVVEDLFPQIQEKILENPDADYGLMGYSMGSITAFVILQEIIKNRLKEPKHIFLAAHEPMTKKEILNIPKSKIDEYVKQRTVQFGGVPENLISNNIFWRVYLPVYKADYLMIAKYDFNNVDFTCDVSATVFYSEKDTKYECMKMWSRYFTKYCSYVEYTGSHFFINEYYQNIADIIQERLENYL